MRRGDKIALVIDTKWKRIAAQIDDARQGVSQSDVYQLMAYAQIYACDRVMLLYPHHQGLAGTAVNTTYSIASSESGNQLHVSTIDVASGRAEITESLSKLFGKCLEEELSERSA